MTPLVVENEPPVTFLRRKNDRRSIFDGDRYSSLHRLKYRQSDVNPQYNQPTNCTILQARHRKEQRLMNIRRLVLTFKDGAALASVPDFESPALMLFLQMICK